MAEYICIYFVSSVFVFRGSDVLKNAKVPHRIVKLSENLEITGCNQCLLILPLYRQRALSALNEAGVRYLSLKEVERL